MLTTTSIRAAADKCGLSQKTLRRYMDDPHFKGAYDAERARMLEEAIASLQTLAGKSIDTLGTVLDDERADSGTRLRCARFVLELMFKGLDLEHRHRIEDVAEEFERFKELVEPLLEERLN
jgi:DNA-binding Lrp family transcriptional regulator